MPAGDDPDVAAGDAEAGQVGLLVGAGGDDRADGAADRGLEPDPLGARAGRDQAVAALGHAELVEGLHDGELQVAGGRQGRQAAGPAQRVDHVGAVPAPRPAQRGAERADLPDQAGVAGAGAGRADVLDRTPGARLGALRQRLAVAPRVHGHLVALPGQVPAHLDQPGVVARGGGGGAVPAGPGTGVLCWATRAIFIAGMPLLVNRGAIYGAPPAPEPSSEERGESGRASTHAKMAWTCLRRRHHCRGFCPRRAG